MTDKRRPAGWMPRRGRSATRPSYRRASSSFAACRRRSEHGFPFLAGPGRLVVKDAIMLVAALATMADSAKAYLKKKGWYGNPVVPKASRMNNLFSLHM